MARKIIKVDPINRTKTLYTDKDSDITAERKRIEDKKKALRAARNRARQTKEARKKQIKQVDHSGVVNNKIPLKKTNIAYIIGGGPSLKSFDFSQLNGDIIAVNKAIEKTKAHVFVTMDYTFLTDRQKLKEFETIKKNAEHSVFVANISNPNLLQQKDGTFYDKRVRLNYERVKFLDFAIKSNCEVHKTTGFALNVNNFACGLNSGFCAVQLALLMGYEEIHLLGFDLKTNGEDTHFHSEYPNRPNYQKELDKFIGMFTFALEKYPHKNKIISHSKDSVLNKYLKYEEYKMETATKPTKVKNDLGDLMVVGYYTINTPYETEAKKTIASCNKFNLNHDIQGVPNFGDWQANTRYKAKFMKEMLIKHKDKRLLYVDCDAEFLQSPDLFKNYNCDVAVRWQDFRWRENECLSGTIYIEPNERTLALCDKWMAANDAEGDTKKVKSFEQWNLGKTIVEMEKTHGLIHKNLPPEYTFIFDHMAKMYPNLNPVIEHYQASRRYKNKLN